MPKVCIVAEYGTLNGGEYSLLECIPSLRMGGWDFSVIAPSPSPFSTALQQRGANVLPFSYHNSHGDRKPLEQIRNEISKLISKQRPQLVHANSLATSRIIGPLATRIDVPRLGHIRDILGLSGQFINDLNQLDQLVAVSEATCRFHAGQGVESSRMAVIHNGVDLERFQPRPASGWLHRELGIPDDLKLVLSVGQIGMRKGTDVTIAAAQRILRDRTDIAFVFVGERHSTKDEALEFERRLLEQSRQTSERIFWLGRRSDVWKIMNEATLLVHSARQEPLGRVLLESLASGLPAIATDVGGTREIYQHDSLLDLVVPTDKPDLLCRVILDCIDDDGRLNKISDLSRRTAIQNFSIERSASALLEMYNRTCLVATQQIRDCQ